MAIQMTNIHKRFGDDVIFSGFDFAVGDKGKVAVMGESGRGKTTLINLICGIIQPDQGVITGVDAQKISVVFQEDRLLPYKSGLANLLFPLRQAKAHTQRAIDLMTQMGLGQDVYKKAALYSGGMKRRLALCRALLTDFDLIILDEPFKGLDVALKSQAMGIVKEQTKNKTLILITHDTTEADFFGATITNI
ncbi:MAG: ATP-binding cassette domain-containing protein [Defluviitaleaceae bacterium]|nr:ATP-binding cassette domain-containing protein [Defluviitaleaceae bacterium]